MDEKMETNENVEMEETEISTEDAAEVLYGMVIEEMQMGQDKSSIADKLVETGMDKSDAMMFVEKVYTEVVELVEKERFDASSILPALIGGVLAAIAGGAVWGIIAVVTDYELGILAWALGGMAGYAVLIFTGGRRGPVMQISAVVSSTLGILLGKYITFFYIFKEMVEKEGEAGVAQGLSMFDPRVILIFVSALPDMLGGFDLVWVVFAVYTAWKIPKGTGITLPDSQMPSTPYGGSGPNMPGGSEVGSIPDMLRRPRSTAMMALRFDNRHVTGICFNDGQG